MTFPSIRYFVYSITWIHRCGCGVRRAVDVANDKIWWARQPDYWEKQHRQVLTDWLTDWLTYWVMMWIRFIITCLIAIEKKFVVFVNKCKYWYTYLRYNIICLSNTYIFRDQSGVLSQIIFTLKFIVVIWEYILFVNWMKILGQIILNDFLSFVISILDPSVCAIKQKKIILSSHLLVNSQ